MTTVLKSLTLEAYRGISGLTLDGLTQFNLLVGANNSGKSSILEAASLLLRPPDPQQWLNIVRQRDSDVALVDGIWAMFPGSEALHPEGNSVESRPIQLRGQTNETGGPRTVAARCVVSVGAGVPGTARVEVSVDGQPELTLKFPSRSTPNHQIPLYRVFTVTPATHYSASMIAQHLSAVVKLGKKDLAVQLLSLFDEDVTDLDWQTQPAHKLAPARQVLAGLPALAAPPVLTARHSMVAISTMIHWKDDQGSLRALNRYT